MTAESVFLIQVNLNNKGRSIAAYWTQASLDPEIEFYVITEQPD